MELHRNLKPAAIVCALMLACLATWLLPTTVSAQETPAATETEATSPKNPAPSSTDDAPKPPTAEESQSCSPTQEQKICERCKIEALEDPHRHLDEETENKEQVDETATEDCPKIETLIETPGQEIEKEVGLHHPELDPYYPPFDPPSHILLFIFICAVSFGAVICALICSAISWIICQIKKFFGDANRSENSRSRSSTSIDININTGQSDSGSDSDRASESDSGKSSGKCSGKFRWFLYYSASTFFLVALLYWLSSFEKRVQFSVNYLYGCWELRECHMPPAPPKPEEVDPSPAHESLLLRNQDGSRKSFWACRPSIFDPTCEKGGSIRFSELLNVGEGHFLFIRDTKRYPFNTRYIHDLYNRDKLGALKRQPSQYFGIVEFDGQSFSLEGRTIPIAELSGDAVYKPLPFDLESACIRETFLGKHVLQAIESGQHHSRFVANYYPRIVQLDFPRLKAPHFKANWIIEQEDRIPKDITGVLGSKPNRGLYNIEGHVCFRQGDLKLRIFAERGSHKPDDYGDFDDYTPHSKLVVDGYPGAPLELNISNPQDIRPACTEPAPGAEWREVSALTRVDDTGPLWGASTFVSNHNDELKLCSLIYTLDLDRILSPNSPHPKAEVQYICDGHKIEGLAFADDGTLLVATDDEKNGGVLATANNLCN